MNITDNTTDNTTDNIDNTNPEEKHMDNVVDINILKKMTPEYKAGLEIGYADGWNDCVEYTWDREYGYLDGYRAAVAGKECAFEYDRDEDDWADDMMDAYETPEEMKGNPEYEEGYKQGRERGYDSWMKNNNVWAETYVEGYQDAKAGKESNVWECPECGDPYCDKAPEDHYDFAICIGPDGTQVFDDRPPHLKDMTVVDVPVGASKTPVPEDNTTTIGEDA